MLLRASPSSSEGFFVCLSMLLKRKLSTEKDFWSFAILLRSFFALTCCFVLYHAYAAGESLIELVTILLRPDSATKPKEPKKTDGITMKRPFKKPVLTILSQKLICSFLAVSASFLCFNSCVIFCWISNMVSVSPEDMAWISEKVFFRLVSPNVSSPNAPLTSLKEVLSDDNQNPKSSVPPAMLTKFSINASLNPSSMISWNTSLIGLTTIPTRPPITDFCNIAWTFLKPASPNIFPTPVETAQEPKYTRGALIKVDQKVRVSV